MAIRCNCGAKVVIRTLWSKNNLKKLYYACSNPGCDCKFIGWVEDEQKRACLNISMKIEQQYLKLKLYLAISWFLFVSFLVYKVWVK
uniref:Zinc finger GRF-type domain-containing protein n=1 Tax=Lactuca sativa TaxID=4236 RepID=A0A9R1W2N2_LACSA|nr:hypothetical protein LSAT_V11C300142590 [Lactuca sativa]